MIRLNFKTICNQPVAVHPEQASPVVDVRVELLQQLGSRQLLPILLVLAYHSHLRQGASVKTFNQNHTKITSRLSTRIVYSFFPFLTPQKSVVRFLKPFLNLW